MVVERLDTHILASESKRVLEDADAFWSYAGMKHDYAEQRLFVRSFLTPPGTLLTSARNFLTPDEVLGSKLTITPRVRKDLNIDYEDTSILRYEVDGHTDVAMSVFMDTPCAYTLEYSQADGKREIMSTVGFTVRKPHKILFIDQVQGGGGFKRQSSKEARRLRYSMKQPEYALVIAVAECARGIGWNTIAIRKPEKNKYKTVRDRKSNGGTTIYDTVIAQLEKQKISEDDTYAYFRVSSAKTN
ncbi:MAG: hypothetical protein WAX38_03005 [Minisyncoccia bacterium]